jgi:hypothetical protein
MASIIVPREGEYYFFLRCTLDDLSAVNTTLALFTNNYTPIKTSIFSNFTICTYTGYASKTLTKSTNWDAVLGDASNKSYAVVNSDQDFTFTGYTGGGYVYGFLIYGTLSAASRCIAACRFDTPAQCFDGLTIRLRPKITMGDIAA